MSTKKKWYVYLLCDPDTKEPFYVGKGSGNRMHMHERMVNHPSETNEVKKETIRRIHAQGKRVLKKKVAEFDDECKAYVYETLLIDEYRPQLTNKRRSGGPLHGSLQSDFLLGKDLRSRLLDRHWAIYHMRYEDIHGFYMQAHFELEAANIRRENSDLLRTWYEKKCQDLKVKPDEILYSLLEPRKGGWR